MPEGNQLISFIDAAARIREESGRVHSQAIRTADLELEEDVLLASGQRWRRTSDGDASLWRLVGMPELWVRNRLSQADARLPADVWNLVARRLSEIGKLDEFLILYAKDDELVLLSETPLQTLMFAEVLDLIEPTLPQDLSPDELEAHQPWVSPEYFVLNIVATKRRVEPRAGDIVEAGISVLHAATDRFPTQVTPYARRCVCDNGMIVVLHPERGGPRVRRVRRRGGDRRRMVDQLAGVMRDAWDHVRPAMEQIRLVASLPLSNHGISSYLQQIRVRYALTNDEINSIESAIESDLLGPTGTVYDIITGLTWAGSHLPGLDVCRRRELLRAGGDVAVNFGPPCELCGTVSRRDQRQNPSAFNDGKFQTDGVQKSEVEK